MKKTSILLLILIFSFSMASCSLPGLTNPQAASGESSAPASSTSGLNNENASSGIGNESASGDNQEPLNPNGKLIKVTLYFATEDNSAIKTEEREIEVVDGAVLKACVNAFLEGPKTSGLHNNVPEGTVFNSINLKNGVAIVDLSKEFGTANGLAEITERIALVNTLTEINGVNSVRIHLNGEDYIGPSGMPLGEMGYTKLDSNGFPVSTVEKTVTLYFGNSNAEKVVAEKRKIQIPEDETLEEAIFLELMKGPRSENLNPTVPKGTRLLSIKTENGLCTIDLSHEFVDNGPGGTAGESMTLNSVVNTLTELSSIKKVQFLIDGKKREVYTHAIFDKPFSRNASFIGE